MAADFHRYYGLSLSSMTSWGIPLHEVAAMAYHLPKESACHRAINPHWQRTIDIDLLRSIEYNQRALLRQSAGKRGGGGYPEPIPLPWDPPPEGSVVGDVMTMEEADRFLGWDKLKAERAKEAKHGD